MKKINKLQTRPTLAAIAVAACFSTAVMANPANPTVVSGTATFAQAGNILNITNGHNAIINWGSFSIGVNELTRFIQPSALSAVLNRVTGQDPSAILGALQSNGRVFLINPNGIVFGSSAQINVAGLVASTLNLSNEDFLNNRMNFTDGAGAGSVVNQGSITGGSVYLIGKAVTNDGLITSPGGDVILAAGNSVELVNPGTPNLRVEVVAPANEAKNLGSITADAGRIGIYAGLVQQGGSLRADSAVVEGGRILLKATKNVHLAAASQTSASGTTGGRVDIQAGDTVIVEGSIATTGSAGAGGTVRVLGDQVGLIGHASINASGDTGGGTVLVGGDYQGKNPDVENAFRTYVGTDVIINADAVSEGDGGKVVVWADDITRYYGNISARGGAQGGNGGFAEVSGKRVLDFQGAANLSAAHGATGTLLLDPEDIDIDAATGLLSGLLEALLGTLGAGTLTDGQLLFSEASSATIAIHPSILNNSTANIILQANEDINVNDPVSLLNNNVSIMLQAGGFLNVNGSITTRGGAITLVAGDPNAAPGQPGGGGLNLNAALDTTAGGFNSGANITLSAPTSDVGGNSMKIAAGINAGASGTVNISGQRIDHDSGTIIGGTVNMTTSSVGSGDINIAGGIQADNVYLESDRSIKLSSTASISKPGAAITLYADSLGNDSGAIVVDGATISGGDITLTGGNGYAAGSGPNNAGISIINGGQIVGAGGTVDLRGRGNNATGGYGVVIDGGSVQNTNGDTFIEGHGGTGAGSLGVKLVNGGNIQGQGSFGSIDVVGIASASGTDGVLIAAGSSPGSSILTNGASGGVDIRVTGSGGAGANGVQLQGAGSVIGGAGARQILLNSLSGGITLEGAVTACSSCADAAITLKSVAGATTSLAALNAYGLRVLGAGTFNIDGSNNFEKVSAALTGPSTLLHVHDLNNLKVGAVTSFDGAATTATTGVNVGTGAGNVVDLHTVAALIDDGGTVTGGQILLEAASIGATGAGNAISVNRGTSGTVSLKSTSGGIFVEQATGSGNMQLSSYTINAASGQPVALTSLGGMLVVDSSLDLAGRDLKLATSGGAYDIMFTGSGILDAANLTLTPDAVNGGVLFSGSPTVWDINAPTTIENSRPLTISGQATANFNSTFTGDGAVFVNNGTTLQFANGADLTSLDTLGTVTGGALDVDALSQSGGSIAVSNLTVNNSFAQSAGTITGTSGNVEIHQGSGNLAVKSASAYGRFKAYAASGDVVLTGASVSGANGPVELYASGNIDINGGSTVSAGSMSPSHIKMETTGGGVTIQNSSVNAFNGGLIDITAATGIMLASTTQATSVNSSGNVTLTSGGNVSLSGGSGAAQYASVSGGMTTIDASGDVILTGGAGAGSDVEIFGANDVFMTVGGMVKLYTGSGAGSTAVIESGIPISVHIHFPNLASGGYFVNGVEGAVTDGSGSGFYAGGSPAQLDNNLIVTYGLTLPPLPPPAVEAVEEALEAPTQTLIVALGESTEPPEAEKDKDLFKDTENDKKKDAPVCK